MLCVNVIDLSVFCSSLLMEIKLYVNVGMYRTLCSVMLDCNVTDPIVLQVVVCPLGK